MFAYAAAAAAHGRKCVGARRAPGGARRVGQKKQTEKAAVIPTGRVALVGGGVRGRMHDQTAVRTEGIALRRPQVRQSRRRTRLAKESERGEAKDGGGKGEEEEKKGREGREGKKGNATRP